MKKIILLVLCIFSCFWISDVKAEGETGTFPIDEITAQLSVSKSYEHVTIVSDVLGRYDHNLYKMTLTNNYNSATSKAFCMNSGLRAKSGLTYKIDREVTASDTTYRKIYQYGISHTDDDPRYFTAQAALWLVEKGYKLSTENHDILASVAKDIMLNINCENYVMSTKIVSRDEAEKTCNRVRNTIPGWRQFLGVIKDKDPIKGSIQEAAIIVQYNIIATELIKSNSIYAGNLYIWKEATGSSGYQPMLAPLNGPTSSKKTCTDISGRVHDYTDEYKACVLAGGNAASCDSTLRLKYCNTVPMYTVKTSVNSAVCSNTSGTNAETSFEYTVEDPDGTDSKYGKLADGGRINDYCSLYCLETEATQEFPGNVSPSVSTGTYIIWPTSDSTISSIYENKYPLKFTGQKTCRLEMAPNTQSRSNIDNIITNLAAQLRSANKNDNDFQRGKDYDTIRINGGCDNNYNPVCSNLKTESENLNEELKRMKSDYENAKKAKEEYERESAACDARNRGCSDELVCNKETGKCSTSRHPCEDCEPSYPIWAPGVIAAFELTQNQYNSTVEKAARCGSQQNACNAFSRLVDDAISVSNQLKTCANYSAHGCSGTSCSAYAYDTFVNLKWTDDEYGTTITDSELEKDVSFSYSIENDQKASINVNKTDSWNKIINATRDLLSETRTIVENKKFNYNVEVTYSLPTTNLLNNYVLKLFDGSTKVQTVTPSAGSNFTTIGYSNLPISINASPKKTYNLMLTDIKFGDHGGQYSPSDYVCKYKVTKATSSVCLCPAGTIYEGKDLFTIMANEDISCLDAQEKYCNRGTSSMDYSCPGGTKVEEMTNCVSSEYLNDYFACYKKYCPDGGDKNEYCPAPYQYINLTPCLENGYDYATCYDKFCVNGPTPNPDDSTTTDTGYKCKNTSGVDGPMDITSCVITKMSQHNSWTLQRAIDECDSLVCPIGGLRIIYRTISLENPFPGKNIIGTVTDFDEINRGRYPGSNWNNLKLVQNHIRTSREYNGSEIYQGEPLYTFELTTSTIEAIREYNEQRVPHGGYADFRLDCRNKNSTACVSSFVHDSSLSGLVNGACANSISASNFYTCSGD